MGPGETAGLVLSTIGICLSLWAVFRAESAKTAVSKVLQKNCDQAARDALRDLFAKLNEAREVAMARRQRASGVSHRGRSTDRDREILQLAQDALATTTVGSDQRLLERLRAASTELNRALNAIATNSDRDGWADALGVLQGIIPDIDALYRELSTKGLR